MSDLDSYYELRQRRVRVGGEMLTVFSRAALGTWETGLAPARLLSEQIDIAPHAQVLNMHCGAGLIACGTFVLIGHVPGDADASGIVDVDDVVFLINYVFAQGPEPVPIESGDVDCSGTVDVDDVVWLINFIFSSGNAPCDIDGDGMLDC